jgi:hypothetical protein
MWGSELKAAVDGGVCSSRLTAWGIASALEPARGRSWPSGLGRVAQKYFGISRAIYLQSKSYLYSHATNGTIRKYQHSDLALRVLQTKKARGLGIPD